MNIKFRNYCMLSDFEKVYQLFVSCYDKQKNTCDPAPFWEYGQTFSDFDYANSHRIGLWELGNELVAVAFYEISLGEAHFVMQRGYECLSDEMITYAETKLRDNKGNLALYIQSGQVDLIECAKRRNYVKTYSSRNMVFDYAKCEMNYPLPKGFRFLANDKEEVDYSKLDKCLFYGFDHDGEPDGDIEWRIHMAITPHIVKSMATVVIDEHTNEYVAFGNAFIVEENRLCYLEPLCTHPQYRKKSLASAVITQIIKKAKAFCTDHITGGSNAFYEKIGFVQYGSTDEYKQK